LLSEWYGITIAYGVSPTPPPIGFLPINFLLFLQVADNAGASVERTIPRSPLGGVGFFSASSPLVGGIITADADILFAPRDSWP
jgi:hypothetical protein